MPVSENIKYPALFSIFELNTKSKYSINKYIDKSKKKSKNNGKPNKRIKKRE